MYLTLLQICATDSRHSVLGVAVFFKQIISVVQTWGSVFT